MRPPAKLVAGFECAFEGRPIPPLPDALAGELAKSGGAFATLLGVRQHDAAATAKALQAVVDDKTKPAARAQLIRALGDVQARAAAVVPLLIHLAESDKEDGIRNAAIASLAKYDDPQIGAAVVKMYNALPPSVRPAAQSLLASRESWSGQLMQAIDSGDIRAGAIQSDTIDKLRMVKEPKAAHLVSRHFPDTRGTAAELEAKITKFKKMITAGGGKPLVGKELFYGRAACAACHTVFDKGGHIGPDLTSYDRRNLDSMLLAIVNPSAEIREGFEDYIVTTKDGRTLDGFKVDEDGKVFVLRGTDGQNNVIPLDQIDTRRVSPRSLMPEGLLDALTETEVRDLFAFLESTTPPK